MVTITCPGCGLPREGEEGLLPPCPICGDGEVLDLPADSTTVEPIPEAPVPASSFRVPAGLWLASGVFIGIMGTLVWQQINPFEDPAPAASAPAATPPALPATAESPTPRPPIVKTNGSQDPVLVLNSPDGAEPPEPEARVVPLDNPTGTSQTFVRPGMHLTLRGRVKKLQITPSLTGGAVVDATGLEVEEVIVAGEIDGGSRLKLNTPTGRVSFRGPIVGKSTVEAVAKSAEFLSTIDGLGTRVSVTLSRGGSLGFARIDGSARLEYRKSAPTDPEPTITRGITGPTASVVRVQ